jgi:hypothetical protein
MLGTVLVADAARAAEVNDLPRWRRDMVAAFDLADQLRREPFPIAQLAGLWVLRDIGDEVSRTLTMTPPLLSDDDLRTLAHRLSRPGSAADLFDLSAERLALLDVVQRTYTDDGDGDGRLTPQGAAWAKRYKPFDDADLAAVSIVTAPLTPGIAVSRKEVIAAYDRVMNLAATTMRGPYRDENWSAWRQQVAYWHSPAGRLRAPVLATVLNDTPQKLHRMSTHVLRERNVLLVALALEQHYRAHGRNPASLDELTPSLLPALPVDPSSGAPPGYLVNDRRAIVYIGWWARRGEQPSERELQMLTDGKGVGLSGVFVGPRRGRAGEERR